MGLDARMVTELRAIQAKLADEGRLYTVVQLDEFYANFRRRFGPEQLARVDGEALLTLMHAHSNRDSLVYWLEFKDDEDFRATFGSIAGGSALKFGIYQRKETGAWMTGSSSSQREISLAEAIAVARRNRDQLALGTAVLDSLLVMGSDADYAELQRRLMEVAPDVCDSAWGHKYFHMMFPGKLDDYHHPDYQRFHLIKLLQLPPAGPGRYLAAGRYAALATELALPMSTLTRILNERDGDPHHYWRLGTTDDEHSYWQQMRDSSLVAIGYGKLGDLSAFQRNQESKDQLKALFHKSYPNDPRAEGRLAQQVFTFVARMNVGDVIVAVDGAKVVGVGRVTGGYSHDPSWTFPHQRPVEWLSLQNWRLNDGLMNTVYELREPVTQVEIERHILAGPRPEPRPIGPPPHDPPSKKTPVRKEAPVLAGILGKIQAVLERKGQVILYGPPGTGKTHWAELAACELAAYSHSGCGFSALGETDKAAVLGPAGLVRLCCFHPAYGYEDFLEGYRPEAVDGKMVFTRRDGVFMRLCKDAEAQPQSRFYLIIDEINRGDIPRIFGELLTSLEKTKRGKSVLLPLSGQTFMVPKNVYVIGTMNTADRSIALLDTALRRRFGFVELMPQSEPLRGASAGGIPLGPWLEALNQRICAHVRRDARNLQVGHSYLLEDGRPIIDFARLSRVVQEDLVPLLEEYCYEDYGALEKILGTGLVDARGQRVRHEVFEPMRQDQLRAALLQPCPEIETSAAAVSAAAAVERDDEDGEE